MWKPTAGNTQERGDVSAAKGEGLAPAGQNTLQAWFPQRQPLLRSRAGSGRKTSTRSFDLQLRLGRKLYTMWTPSGCHSDT